MKKNRARSEGGTVSHFSSILGDRHPTVQIIDDDDDNDDDVREVPAPTPARSSTGLPSRLSLFVTPAPGEPRTSSTPGRRSTSALQARRASSAPHADTSSPQISNSYIDLTGFDDSDEEAESGNGTENIASGEGEDKKEEGTVQAKDDSVNGAIGAADVVPAPFNLGTKRARLTSPASEGGGGSKRQKSSNEVRTGSLPLTLPALIFPAPTWAFPPAERLSPH